MTDAEFWRTHCWSKQVGSDKVCAKPARWMGPQVGDYALNRAWRACDDHHTPSDVPIDGSSAYATGEPK